MIKWSLFVLKTCSDQKFPSFIEKLRYWLAKFIIKFTGIFTLGFLTMINGQVCKKKKKFIIINFGPLSLH